MGSAHWPRGGTLGWGRGEPAADWAGLVKAFGLTPAVRGEEGGRKVRLGARPIGWGSGR